MSAYDWQGQFKNNPFGRNPLLTGGIFAPPQVNGGLMGDDQSAAKRDALMAAAASLLQGSGWSPQRRSFGELVGQAMLSAQNARAQSLDNAQNRRLKDAQIEALGRKEMQSQSPFGNIDPDQFTPESLAKFQQTGNYGDLAPRGQHIGNYNPGDYTPESWAQFAKGNDPSVLKRYVTPQPEPLVAVQTPQGSIFLPRSQAIGKQPAAPKEGALPTEGERTAANYLGRMQAAEGLLGDYTPSMTDYVAAQNLMAGGAVRSGIANAALSEDGQAYYQAAADWVRAKLRKESGAVISPEEMAQEIKTYFPVPGDSTKTIEQKRQSRLQAQAGMKEMSGRAGGVDLTVHPKGSPEDSRIPAVGAIEDGYRFKGGDPSKRTSWEKVK